MITVSYDGKDIEVGERLGSPYQEVERMSQISDGYHTFGELYRYRMLLQAMLFNTAGIIKEFPVMKSWRHSDGELPFGKKNYFVVVAELPTGQVTNHYTGEYWDLFHVTEVERAPEWDGHSASEAADRMERYIKSDSRLKNLLP